MFNEYIDANDIKRLYGDDKPLWWSDYDPIIQSLAPEIIKNIQVGDYQGDTYLLLKNGYAYGYLCFGWGSCSGCDALQACNNANDVANLRNALFDEIKWFNSKSELLAWMTNHDWKGDFVWHCDMEAINEIIDYLKQE